ncbi:MAG: hypothetical protein AB7N65_18440, partial [Vicinamibacterales bacterium]
MIENIGAFAGDGLFSAHGDEPNWGKPHRILMPVFSPVAMRDMFDGMDDIADQMLTRGERFGEHAVIDVTDNMTRLRRRLSARPRKRNAGKGHSNRITAGSMPTCSHEALGETWIDEKVMAR